MARLPKYNSKGNVNFPGMVETMQPNVPDYATRVHNPNGMVMQNANGTIVDGAGGDGRQWPPFIPADGMKWNSNCVPDAPDPYAAVPGILPVSRKLKR